MEVKKPDVEQQQKKQQLQPQHHHQQQQQQPQYQRSNSLCVATTQATGQQSPRKSSVPAVWPEISDEFLLSVPSFHNHNHNRNHNPSRLKQQQPQQEQQPQLQHEQEMQQQQQERNLQRKILLPRFTVINSDNISVSLSTQTSAAGFSVSSDSIFCQQQQQQQQQQHRQQIRRNTLIGDVCQLCDSANANENGCGHGGRRSGSVELEQCPGAVRWKYVPCLCRDRYLHLHCLESRFDDAAVLKHGKWRLILECPRCRQEFVVTRKRSRRNCDRNAALSFIRHLVASLLISAFFLTFGIWSMLHPRGGKPHFFNISLVVIGSAVMMVFAIYEIWLLHERFEFVITQVVRNVHDLASENV